MKKMPCLFVRDFTDKRRPLISEQVTPGCEWVLNGEGVATRKWDGTACLLRGDGKSVQQQLFKRYDAKRGKEPPRGFEPASDPDPVTGHWPGWVPVDLINPDSADVWHALAYWQAQAFGGALEAGSYELIGPKINGNAEKKDRHIFVPHGESIVVGVDRSFIGIRAYLERAADIEGIVFWRSKDDPSCDKVKIRRDDFGFAWPVK